MRKCHLFSRTLTQERSLVCNGAGGCVSGFAQWHVVRTLAPDPSCAPQSACLELGLGHLPCPSRLYTNSLEKNHNSDGCGRGKKSEEKLSFLQEPLLPPHRNPTYCKMSLGGPVRGQGSGVLYQGCSEHILFFKRTMFVNFLYTGKLWKMYLIL